MSIKKPKETSETYFSEAVGLAKATKPLLTAIAFGLALNAVVFGGHYIIENSSAQAAQNQEPGDQK